MRQNITLHCTTATSEGSLPSSFYVKIFSLLCAFTGLCGLVLKGVSWIWTDPFCCVSITVSMLSGPTFSFLPSLWKKTHFVPLIFIRVATFNFWVKEFLPFFVQFWWHYSFSFPSQIQIVHTTSDCLYLCWHRKWNLLAALMTIWRLGNKVNSQLISR